MIQDLVQHIDRLIQQRPAAKTALTPFRELALLMVQVDPQAKPVEFEKEVMDIKQQEGFPLFSKEDSCNFALNGLPSFLYKINHTIGQIHLIQSAFRLPLTIHTGFCASSLSPQGIS